MQGSEHASPRCSLKASVTSSVTSFLVSQVERPPCESRMLLIQNRTTAPLRTSSPATRQRNDRKADFRCGANPQRGESSWVFRQKIYRLSPLSLPPGISGIGINCGAKLSHLTLPYLRAHMDMRLTVMRMENGAE